MRENFSVSIGNHGKMTDVDAPQDDVSAGDESLLTQVPESPEPPNNEDSPGEQNQDHVVSHDGELQTEEASTGPETGSSSVDRPPESVQEAADSSGGESNQRVTVATNYSQASSHGQETINEGKLGKLFSM